MKSLPAGPALGVGGHDACPGRSNQRGAKSATTHILLNSNEDMGWDHEKKIVA